MEDIKVSTTFFVIVPTFFVIVPTFFVIVHTLNICQLSKIILTILVGRCVCLSTSGLVVGF